MIDGHISRLCYLAPMLLILDQTFRIFPFVIYNRKVAKCAPYPSDCEHICQLLANAFKISL